MKIIGIDPDIEKPGVCILDESGSIDTLRSASIDLMINAIRFYIDEGYTFAIEDVERNKPVFSRGKMSAAAKANIAQKVGMVKGAARIIIKMIEFYDGKVVLVNPGVGKQVKNNAKLFNELSGWQGRSNEDMRDAWAIAKVGQKMMDQDK